MLLDQAGLGLKYIKYESSKKLLNGNYDPKFNHNNLNTSDISVVDVFALYRCDFNKY